MLWRETIVVTSTWLEKVTDSCFAFSSLRFWAFRVCDGSVAEYGYVQADSLVTTEGKEGCEASMANEHSCGVTRVKDWRAGVGCLLIALSVCNEW